MTETEPLSAEAPAPLVWVLAGFKAGDTTQMLALADALGYGYDVKRLVYRSAELLTNRLLRVTLAGLDRSVSSRLEPPWPALIITAGRRNEPVARWIQRAAGGNSRIVHLGRPWAPLDRFDLIVTTPQYQVPARDNVMEIPLPLHNVTPQRLEQWRDRWADRLEQSPAPRWAVLLGGDSGPFVFNAKKAVRLARWVDARVRDEGGSLWVTDSARTPAAAYRAFLANIACPVTAYHWTPRDKTNPYQGFLACADRLVVTGESMSMLTEAAATGRPLYIFDLADCPASAPDPSAVDCRPWWRIAHNYRYKPLTHRLAMRFAPARMRRDISRIQQGMVTAGRAVWAVGDAVADGGEAAALAADLEAVVTRVRSLLE
jgi:mitochondrial fission protein ELM1